MCDKLNVRRVRELLIELADVLSEAEGEETTRAGEEEPPGALSTGEVARMLGVSQGWVTAHIDLFPGTFRLGDGKRPNYRFPTEAVEAYKKKMAV